MTNKLTAETLRQAAKRALDDRVELVPAVLRAQEDSDAARRAANEAERAHAAAWTAALSGGWTPGELKALGLTEPGRKAPGRPRRAKTTNKAAGVPQSPSEAPTPPVETPPVA